MAKAIVIFAEKKQNMDKFTSKGQLFARYLWLYGEIVSKGPITFANINRDWMKAEMNDTKGPLPHKTFENHRQGIQDLFRITVECDRTNNTYYIDSSTSLDYTRATLEMLNGAILFNRLQSDPSMSKYIRVEHYGEDSSMLFTITDALSESREILLLYRHNYDPQRDTQYHVKPISVKQFRRRWYLIAELEDKSVYSFALDRIRKIEKGNRIEPSQMDVDRLFANAFGIIREKGIEAEKITLKVDREQANYFMSRPLHSSQKILSRDENFVHMEVRLCPTYDFMMELLSHGAKIEVIAPDSLRENIATKIKEMSETYKK